MVIMYYYSKRITKKTVKRKVRDMNSKKAIAVISFGTTYLDTADKTIHAVEREVADSFKGYRVVSAYTSTIVRNALLSVGVTVPSPSECFENLLEDGYRDVIVLPTHIIRGEEYSKVVECVEGFASRFDSIRVCRPLIDAQDVPNAVDAIQKVFTIPQGQEFLVFMGHGSPTDANAIYHLINEEFAARNLHNMYMATVEATPELTNAIDTVRAYQPTKVTLTPFMLVAGDHANNDMNVEWKTMFEGEQFDTTCILKGLGEYHEFRRMYIDRVKEVLC